MKKILLLAGILISFVSCRFSDSPKYDDSTKGTVDNPVKHTGNAAVLDSTGAQQPSHDSGYQAHMDSNEANDVMGGTPSGKGTTGSGTARHDIGNSQRGTATAGKDTSK